MGGAAPARLASAAGRRALPHTGRTRRDHAVASASCGTTANPWPRINITVDPQIWPQYATLDTLLTAAGEHINTTAEELKRKLSAIYAGQTPSRYAQKLRAGAPLRVLGITSRYTTFLQHSMRDWLEAMRAMGHETRLIIESADHEKLHPLQYLREFADFRPDLLLLIDHYRGEFPLMPTACPAVMWVQDRLPNIFRVAAGDAQGPMDFAIGYGRLDCVNQFNYPRARFMESPIGVNESRFVGADLPREEAAGYRCEVAFVSHASATPEALIQEQIDRQGGSAEARRLFGEIFERLNAVYSRGDCVTHEHALHRIVAESMTATAVALDDHQPLIDFVTHKLNNAFFRHQALHWLVDEQVDLHVYGKGWENHPKFSKYARGVADNQRQLAAIYQSAAVNLQVAPFGSAHQRVFEGLCAGGFFLMRRVTGDDLEPLYRELWEFVRGRGVRTIDELRDTADDRINAVMHQIEDLSGVHPLLVRHDLVDALNATAAGGFTRASSTLWPEDFPRVAFSNREELLGKLRHFLANPQERLAVAARMRDRVLETVTYRGISRRMLSFIADELSHRSVGLEAAA